MYTCDNPRLAPYHIGFCSSENICINYISKHVSILFIYNSMTIDGQTEYPTGRDVTIQCQSPYVGVIYYVVLQVVIISVKVYTYIWQIGVKPWDYLWFMTGGGDFHKVHSLLVHIWEKTIIHVFYGCKVSILLVGRLVC